MPVNGKSFEHKVQEVMRKQGVDEESARRIVGSIEQKRAKLLKLRMAAVGITFDEKSKRREKIQDFNKSSDGKDMPRKGPMAQRRVKQEVQNINTGAPIRPTKADAKINLNLRKKLAKEHHHSIVFKGHDLGQYRAASLEGQQGKYAKYWLLNAKQTNGNGWGIAAHTAKANMKKFIGRPLVVTSAKWHGASEYGDSFEHPYLPTNDIQQILGHQEKFRVGSIVDVGEKNGDFYATIEMLPKFANMTLPPFCSPAIYQLNAQEHEGNISEWEALHLAALDENPAYGARIALLKGTCVGTEHACKVQFKSAKQLNATIMDEDVANNTKKTKKKKMFDKNNPRFRGIMEAQVVCPNKVASIQRKLDNLKKNQKIAIDKRVNTGLGIISPGGIDASKIPLDRKPTDIERFTDTLTSLTKGRIDMINKIGDVTKDPTGLIQLEQGEDRIVNPRAKKIHPQLSLGNILKKKDRMIQLNRAPTKGTSLAKLKAKIASLGEQNMTFQNSKKVKIHKKKHPEVRKAKSNVEDILRKAGSSVDGSHHQSTFLSPKGDFIGGGDIHDIQIRNILDPTGAFGETVTNKFIKEHGLGRIQTFPINRAGEKKTSVHFESKATPAQIKAVKDLETGGRNIGFLVGDETGSGSRDFIRALGRLK